MSGHRGLDKRCVDAGDGREEGRWGADHGENAGAAGMSSRADGDHFGGESAHGPKA